METTFAPLRPVSLVPILAPPACQVVASIGMSYPFSHGAGWSVRRESMAVQAGCGRSSSTCRLPKSAAASPAHPPNPGQAAAYCGPFESLVNERWQGCGQDPIRIPLSLSPHAVRVAFAHRGHCSGPVRRWLFVRLGPLEAPNRGSALQTPLGRLAEIGRSQLRVRVRAPLSQGFWSHVGWSGLVHR